MVAIIGGGISGCVLARRLAELQFKVHLYEKESHYGGVAQQENFPFSLVTTTAKSFLRYRCEYVAEYKKFRPKFSWHHLCSELLEHRNILRLYSAPVENLQVLSEEYPLIFSTASPDALLYYCYGYLHYNKAMPVRGVDDIQRFSRYRSLLQVFNIFPVGASGRYLSLTIEQCVLYALQTADLFGRFYITGNKRQLDTGLQETWVGEAYSESTRRDRSSPTAIQTVFTGSLP